MKFNAIEQSLREENERLKRENAELRATIERMTAIPRKESK